MAQTNGCMSGKICIVTGANSGMGKATSLELAKMGATVVMVCRDEARGEDARSEIQAKSGNPEVALLLADLSSQKSVRHLVRDFTNQYQQLHVLVNNAGLALHQRILTEDGLECTFAVNHLASFLLTTLLLDVLKVSTPARIVNVSSTVQRWGTIDFADLQGAKRYSLWRAYSQSKLANILFTYELARRLEGTGVTVNCLHPGVVATNFFGIETGVVLNFLATLGMAFERTPERGAQTAIYLASASAVESVTGKYFVDCKQKRSSKQSYDVAIQQRLWQVSQKLTQGSA